jgi:hypothetical protein
MKYIKKIGENYTEISEKDINRYAPKSIGEAFKMWIFGSVFFLILLLIVVLFNKFLGLFM